MQPHSPLLHHSIQPSWMDRFRWNELTFQDQFHMVIGASLMAGRHNPYVIAIVIILLSAAGAWAIFEDWRAFIIGGIIATVLYGVVYWLRPFNK